MAFLVFVHSLCGTQSIERRHCCAGVFDCSICHYVLDLLMLVVMRPFCVFRLFVCGCFEHVCDASTFQMFVLNVPHMFASV